MNADYFRTLFDYNYVTLQSVWDSVLTLSDDQFVRDVNYSVGSIRNHVVHLTDTDRRWLQRIKGDPLSDRLAFADYETAADIHAVWLRVRDDVLTFVDSLDDDALNRIVEFDMPHRGGIHRNTVWQILAHMVNHATDHRAQLLRLLYEFGAPTFEQDIIVYLWSR